MATKSTVRRWDPPGLAPREKDDRCALHKGGCAYRDDDPDRCPKCHRSWRVITGWDGQTREEHVASHEPKPKKQAA